MCHIHRLRKLDPAHAYRSLKRYLVERLAVERSQEFVENALIALVWMFPSPECTNEIASLDATFTEPHLIRTKPLSSEATNGILLLLWSRIEKTSEKEEYGLTASWCKLAIHELFSGSMDDVNAGKLRRFVNRYTRELRGGVDLLTRRRKLLQCPLKQARPGEAQMAALKMSANVAQQPLSLYLTYCIATRVGDEDLGKRKR